MEVLSKREAIVALIEDPETDPELAARLSLVLDIRRFATDELHLPDNRSYTQYADLGRDAVVWNVIAAPEFSLTPKTWCYPVAGCVAYRGYFRRERADRLAARLRDEGWDVSVSPVPAYSTLGRFADPVLSTMMHWSDPQLAGIIFHELTHQKTYVRGDTMFNEAYATFVERIGVERWLAGQNHLLETWRRKEVLNRQFRALIMATRDELNALYARDLPAGDMRAAKAAAIETLKTRYRDFSRRAGDGRYDGWAARDLNNAHLALFFTYEAGVEAFAGLFERVGGDIELFHRAVQTVAEGDESARTAFLNGTTE